MLVLMLISPLIAADETDDETGVSLEMLEFLGEWETDEGEWIDPDSLDNEVFAELTETVNDESKQNE